MISNRFKIVFLCCFVIGLFFVFTGTSYSLIESINDGALSSNAILANLIVQGDTNIELHDTKILDDEHGLKNDSYKFNLVNKENAPVFYSLYLRDNEKVKNNCTLPCSFINNDSISYSLTKEMARFKSSILNDNYIIDTGIIGANTTIEYSIKVWISSDTMDTIYYGNIESSGSIIK